MMPHRRDDLASERRQLLARHIEVGTHRPTPGRGDDAGIVVLDLAVARHVAQQELAVSGLDFQRERCIEERVAEWHCVHLETETVDIEVRPEDAYRHFDAGQVPFRAGRRAGGSVFPGAGPENPSGNEKSSDGPPGSASHALSNLVSSRLAWLPKVQGTGYTRII